MHRELARPGVTRQLLWEEYRAAHPEGIGYTAFCVHYQRWRRAQALVLRQNHLPGDKLFVDYAGQTVPITDRYTGEQRSAQIFVAVLGASNYTFAEATWSQRLPDWLGSHVRSLEFFVGVPRAILPARVRRPRDKAKVEAGVLVVERWIRAQLRHRTFFSLEELNTAIDELLVSLNERPFKKMSGSRRSRLLEREASALRALPARAYESAEWRVAKVHPDYHVEVGRAYYSVPYRLIGERVDVRLSAQGVEIFHAGRLAEA